jgi:hypothetical protein
MDVLTALNYADVGAAAQACPERSRRGLPGRAELEVRAMGFPESHVF